MTTTLSTEQAKAIEKVQGQTLLLAVPGSGKTTTLIARVGRMIYDFGIPPEQILVITYTNEAARDMKARYVTMFGPEHADRIDFRTINSFCYSVVTRYARLTGRTKPEDDIDLEANVRMLFESVYDEKFPDPSEIRDLAQQITYIKNMGLTAEEIEGLRTDTRDVRPMYDAYCTYMKDHHKMDYDDQIVFAKKIFAGNIAGLRDYFADRYPYVLVDEAQDTSKLQHEVIRLLVAKHGNIFMVGDEDQSIYGFRAAYPDALIRFKQTYENAQIFSLQTNYRSAPTIVGLAARVIKNNKSRYDKTMEAAREGSGKVITMDIRNRMEQYEKIAGKLCAGTETAILYRNNDSALPFISYFEEAGIRYRCKGIDTMFFTSKVVADAIDIMRFAFDPASRDLMWKLYYKFDLRISRKTLYSATKTLGYGDRRDILSVLRNASGVYQKQREKIDDLRAQLEHIRRGDNAKDAIGRIRSSMGYRNASSEKLFILQAMAQAGESVSHFIRRLGELERAIGAPSPHSGADVILSTIHSSKGLEYEKVILVDAVDDIFPSPESDLEEERRLFYVGMTRAKDELVIANYIGRRSTFLDEVRGRTRKATSRKGSHGVTDTGVVKRSVEPAPEDTGIKPGTLVRHRKFGTGKVISVQGDTMTVDFGRQGRKSLSIAIVLEKGIVELA